MYEATIALPINRQYLLQHIHNKLKTLLQQAGGISTHYSNGDTVFLSVACNEVFGYQAKKQIVDAVSEVLSLGYKNVYIRQKLHIVNCDFWQNLLVNTLSTFDNHADKLFVSTVLDVNKPIFVEGYYNFSINWLKVKWQELVNLVQDNNLLLHDHGAVCDFLQYLLQTQTCKIDTLTVTMQQDDFQLFSSSGVVLAPFRSLAENATVEEEVALNALCLNAKKVKLCYNGKPSDDFCNVMQKLFSMEYFPLE